MPKISFDLPDGLDAAQTADLAAWIEHQIELVTAKRLPVADDPEWQAEAVRRIKRGMQDVKAGRVMDSREARRRLDGQLRPSASG